VTCKGNLKDKNLLQQ